MSRLIDLDQTIFVPIVDESKGGVSYEMQMTIAEFFDRFLDGFKPEVVDAVPVEWLRQYAPEKWSMYMQAAVEIIIEAWQKEQGVHDVRTQAAHD